MNPAKIEKMDEEIAKWRKKDPIAIKKSMSKPGIARFYIANKMRDRSLACYIMTDCTILLQRYWTSLRRETCIVDHPGTPALAMDLHHLPQPEATPKTTTTTTIASWMKTWEA